MSERIFRKVIVFGATSAVAQAVVRRLAEAGAELFLVARNAANLEAVAADARVRGAGAVWADALDLDRVDEFPALLARAFAALGGGVDLAIVAHGVLASSDECEASPSAAARVLTTDFTASAMLAQATALRLAERGRGVLVVIGSVAGDRGRQSNYVYGAAKAGLAVFADGLRNRMHPRGVHVLTVKPGFVDTPMTAAMRKNALFASPDRVARDILRACARRTAVLYTPWFWRLVMFLVRAVPEPMFKRLRL